MVVTENAVAVKQHVPEMELAALQLLVDSAIARFVTVLVN